MELFGRTNKKVTWSELALAPRAGVAHDHLEKRAPLLASREAALRSQKSNIETRLGACQLIMCSSKTRCAKIIGNSR